MVINAVPTPMKVERTASTGALAATFFLITRQEMDRVVYRYPQTNGERTDTGDFQGLPDHEQVGRRDDQRKQIRYDRNQTNQPRSVDDRHHREDDQRCGS